MPPWRRSEAVRAAHRDRYQRQRACSRPCLPRRQPKARDDRAHLKRPQSQGMPAKAAARPPSASVKSLRPARIPGPARRTSRVRDPLEQRGHALDDTDHEQHPQEAPAASPPARAKPDPEVEQDARDEHQRLPNSALDAVDPEREQQRTPEDHDVPAADKLAQRSSAATAATSAPAKGHAREPVAPGGHRRTGR